MTQSTFYADGYRAGATGEHPYPPCVPVLANEYWEGYWQAVGDHGVELAAKDYAEGEL